MAIFIIIGISCYTYYNNKKKNHEILKLKYKLRRAVKIIKSHDPTFESVVDGGDALSTQNPSIYQKLAPGGPASGGAGLPTMAVVPNMPVIKEASNENM